jgi:hypothetical protein
MKQLNVLSRRLRVKLQRHRLDHQLADGLDPLDLTERALRASQLAAMPTRRRIARSLRPPVFTTSVWAGALSEWSLDSTRATICPWTL